MVEYVWMKSYTLAFEVFEDILSISLSDFAELSEVNWFQDFEKNNSLFAIGLFGFSVSSKFSFGNVCAENLPISSRL